MPSPRSSGRTGSSTSSTRWRGADEQEPAGRVPRLRRRGRATGSSSGSSTWPRAISSVDRVDIRRRNLIPARPSPTARRPATSTTAATTRACSGRCSADVDYDHWVDDRRDGARAEGGTSASASSHPTSAAYCRLQTEFWFWFDKPEFTPTLSPESASLQIDPTGNIVVTLHSQSLWGNGAETVVSQAPGLGADLDLRPALRDVGVDLPEQIVLGPVARRQVLARVRPCRRLVQRRPARPRHRRAREVVDAVLERPAPEHRLERSRCPAPTRSRADRTRSARARARRARARRRRRWPPPRGSRPA